MTERTPDIYERTQRLLDKWKKDIFQADKEVRARLMVDEPSEWLIGVVDDTRIRHAELESVLRGNCPPSKGETKMLPKDTGEGGKPPKGKPPIPPSPFRLE